MTGERCTDGGWRFGERWEVTTSAAGEVNGQEVADEDKRMCCNLVEAHSDWIPWPTSMLLCSGDLCLIDENES